MELLKKIMSLYTYGLIIIAAGIFLLAAQYNALHSVKITLGICLTVGAFFAFLTAFFRKREQVQFAYHEMHALAMMVYGISLLAFCKTSEALIYSTAVLFLFYSFSEMIFCNWLFNLGNEIEYRVVGLRLFFGLISGIGTLVIMHYSDVLQIESLKGFGILFIVIGVNILLYVPVMKKIQHQG